MHEMAQNNAKALDASFVDAATAARASRNPMTPSVRVSMKLSKLLPTQKVTCRCSSPS